MCIRDSKKDSEITVIGATSDGIWYQVRLPGNRLGYTFRTGLSMPSAARKLAATKPLVRTGQRRFDGRWDGPLDCVGNASSGNEGIATVASLIIRDGVATFKGLSGPSKVEIAFKDGFFSSAGAITVTGDAEGYDFEFTGSHGKQIILNGTWGNADCQAKLQASP